MKILNYESFLESAQVIRDFIKGDSKFSEKGNDMDSGGKLDDDLANIFIQILAEIKKQIPSLKVVITAGNDQFHKKLGYSKHSAGKALDFVINPYNATNAQKVKDILDQHSSYYKGFTYLDEYTRPSAASTGGHFHVAYDPAKPEGTHAKKVTYSGAPKDLRKPNEINFPFGKIKSYSGQDNPGVDTWAGLLKSLERNR
jgi:hypothetical protein